MAWREAQPPAPMTEFEDTPILFSNHFLVQHQPHEFVLTFGQVTGPPVVGTPEQVRAQACDLNHVPIHTPDEHDRMLGSS